MAFAALPAVAQAAPEVIGEAKKLMEWVLDQMGLSKETNYEGAVPLAGLGLYGYYTAVKPALEDLYTIRKQTIGVLEQAYKWLGGAGNAINAAESAVGNAVKTIEGYF